MRITSDTTDSAAVQAIGTRIARHRLNRNLTQASLAAEAGVSLPTVQRLEQGKSCQASSLIRILRALGYLAHLDGLVPEPPASPIQQFRMHGKLRRRASSTAASRIRERPAAWTWGDER
jgi:transcriptional regulator with XRE-family HTH domain